MYRHRFNGIVHNAKTSFEVNIKEGVDTYPSKVKDAHVLHDRACVQGICLPGRELETAENPLYHDNLSFAFFRPLNE
ncbi:hypothetical protein LENED_003937 [Lentinula edodes]|uniref:Uncharacterized protein n=1 Tax=Lentinula edodes TaxID=5353 RepID=A0A1Q3E4X1_LENED|nr:hypothetical protein LENED_003937 [Lentinula edodes]